MTAENTIDVTIENRDKLKQSYLSFLQHGGLIIPTQSQLGCVHTVRLNLFSEDKPLSFNGKVVWLAPVGAQLPQFNGVGVEFTGDNAKDVRSKIESALSQL